MDFWDQSCYKHVFHYLISLILIVNYTGIAGNKGPAHNRGICTLEFNNSHYLCINPIYFKSPESTWKLHWEIHLPFGPPLIEGLRRKSERWQLKEDSEGNCSLAPCGEHNLRERSTPLLADSAFSQTSSEQLSQAAGSQEPPGHGKTAVPFFSTRRKGLCLCPKHFTTWSFWLRKWVLKKENQSKIIDFFLTFFFFLYLLLNISSTLNKP